MLYPCCAVWSDAIEGGYRLRLRPFDAAGMRRCSISAVSFGPMLSRPFRSQMSISPGWDAGHLSSRRSATYRVLSLTFSRQNYDAVVFDDRFILYLQRRLLALRCDTDPVARVAR